MDYKRRVQQTFLDSGVVLKGTKLERIEYTDFGLGAIEIEGLNSFIYEDNERYCEKELVLLPYQTCPEYQYPPRDENEGKKEAPRCWKGLAYLYVEEKETKKLSRIIPKGQERYHTIKKEIVFYVGDQYMVEQSIKHWFQAGATGVVITEFSPNSDDPSNSFTNPTIYR